MIKYIRGMGLLIIVSYSFLMMIGCEDVQVQQKIIRKEQPTQVIKDAHIFRSENGQVDVELKSPIIYSYEGENSRMIFPKGVKAWFFNKDLTTKAMLTAQYAINYNSTNKVFLRDSVVIINYNKKDTLYCQELIWDKNLKRINSNKPVRRVSEAGISFGDGFESTETFDSLRIKNIRGIHNVNDNE